MPVTISYHAGSRKGSIGVAGSEFSAAAVTTAPTNAGSVAPPMNQGPRQRRDRLFVRAAGFLSTVIVQIISRIPPTSSDSLMTMLPPVIGIHDEAQHVTGWVGVWSGSLLRFPPGVVDSRARRSRFAQDGFAPIDSSGGQVCGYHCWSASRSARTATSGP